MIAVIYARTRLRDQEGLEGEILRGTEAVFAGGVGSRADPPVSVVLVDVGHGESEEEQHRELVELRAPG